VKRKRKITRWAFCGDEDLREVTRASQENPELLRADMSSESSALLILELGSCSSLASRGLGLNALPQSERWIVIISRIRRNRGIEIKPFLSEIDNKTLRTDAMFSVLFPVGGFYCFCVWTQGKSWKEISCLRLKKKKKKIELVIVSF
jgi:hypothetical protein